MVRGDIEAFVGVPVLDELFYRLLLAQIKEKTGENPLNVLRRDLPGTLEQYSGSVDSGIRQFITLPHLAVVGVEAMDGERMMDNIRLFKLLPRDALHVAIMQRLNISIIASDDTDFDRVDGFERAWLINPPLDNSSDT
jgi:predicted nucleic acid-binding protein